MKSDGSKMNGIVTVKHLLAKRLQALR